MVEWVASYWIHSDLDYWCGPPTPHHHPNLELFNFDLSTNERRRKVTTDQSLAWKKQSQTPLPKPLIFSKITQTSRILIKLSQKLLIQNRTYKTEHANNKLDIQNWTSINRTYKNWIHKNQTYKNWKYKTRHAKTGHTKLDIQNWTYKTRHTNWTYKIGRTKTGKTKPDIHNRTYTTGHTKPVIQKLDIQKQDIQNQTYKTRHTKLDLQKLDIQNWTYKNWWKTGHTKTKYINPDIQNWIHKLDLQKWIYKNQT